MVRCRSLVGALGCVLLLVACKPSDDAPASDAGTTSDGPAADVANPADAATEGGSACGGGSNKPATPAMIGSMTVVLGGWRFANLRGTDGKDKPLGNPQCDPSIDYYFVPSTQSPNIDQQAISDGACAVANGLPLEVIGGTDVAGYPNCPILSCGPGTLGMLWDDEVHVGRIYAYDANKKQGPLVATIQYDTVDSGQLLFIQGATTWTMKRGVLPTCK